MRRIAIVIPCFNEAARFAPDEVARLLEDSDVELLLVDDGSRDATKSVLEAFAARHAGRARVLALPQNQGKAEAVRQGLVAAMEHGASVVAYTDADLATPVDEILRLVAIAAETDHDAVIGARIARLGANIDRKPFRHYAGRAFATMAALALGVRVYDTQCGTKVFRATPNLRDAIAERFHSRWAFDVELLGRLLARDADIVEIPLRKWVDVAGSKLRMSAMLKAGADLAWIARDVRRKR